ncbi:MAG TPA: RluA family pseudouridine synthase [Parafilimonas sp.]|nr:RluA family pseudouridine synthase [Parafilimonas sp.]
MKEAVDIIKDEVSDELYERKSFKVDAGQQPLRIDKWVQQRIENASRNKVQQAIDAGFLTVNLKQVKSNYKVKPGDEILLMSFINPEYTEVKPENIPLNIVYEDDEVMVINKSPNMVVHPGVGNYTGTLLNGIAYHLLKQNPDITEEELPRYGLVHRIDKNTTGLIAVAKTAEAAAHLAKQFFNHTVQRKYIALVWGNIEKDSGTIEAHVGRHQRHRKMFDAYPEGESGKHAITHYKVIERFNYVTLVECKLETGRTHQIRVHMKHIGHTLFNDAEYGGDKILKGTIYSKYKQFVDNCFEVCPRVALHAATLGFVHPKTNKEMFFEAPLPDDMKLLVEKWRNYVLK